METRREIYGMLQEVLGAMDEVKHVDLWNHNVEYIEQEDNWQRPAVFVEFGTIDWDAVQCGVEYRAEPVVRLHIVTDWAGSSAMGSEHQEEALAVFDLSEKIQIALAGRDGTGFRDFDLSSSVTNHNHEEIIEMIDTYNYIAIRSIG